GRRWFDVRAVRAGCAATLLPVAQLATRGEPGHGDPATLRAPAPADSRRQAGCRSRCTVRRHAGRPTTWQRAAVAAVPGARLFVLTGGPGTGKTTTVVRMLLMLLRHAEACGLPVQPSIALAAPTGKAAQRLAQAIARGK